MQLPKMIVGIGVLLLIVVLSPIVPYKDMVLCVNACSYHYGELVTSFILTSPAFTNGSYIPDRYACLGINISPELQINNTPTGTQSLALIMDDPDAKAVAGYTWVHWLLWNISPSITVIQQNSVPANTIRGRNSWGDTEYGGPCPPEGRDHLYFFKLYALDINITISSTDVDGLMAAMGSHIIDQAVLTGRYSKSGPPASNPTTNSSNSKISSSTTITTSQAQTTPTVELLTLITILTLLALSKKKKRIN
jgi:Raf kinase inhibitor-like YbhB/YbcL family protein